MTTEENKKLILSTKCPKCGQVVKFCFLGQEGIAKIKCPHAECGHTFGVKITEKEIKLGMGNHQKDESHPVTDPIINTSGNPSGVVIARLLQKKRYFYNKDKFHDLKLGANTIGMYDSSSPSDIMIEGDRTISHRSVTIMVESVGTFYKYLLTVNKSKNPVYLSGKEIPVGTSVYIQLNQVFTLGKRLQTERGYNIYDRKTTASRRLWHYVSCHSPDYGWQYSTGG